jgi:hypothetical protein
MFTPVFFLILFHRLGPLSIEQKKRAMVKRAKLEKNKDEERKPQELKEGDISRSQNETTKNVATVSTGIGYFFHAYGDCYPFSWKQYYKRKDNPSTYSASS